jgi:ribonuclease-3
MAVRDTLEPAAARHLVTAPAGPDPAGIAEAILGHSFAQPGLLHEALTHRSAAHGRAKPLRRGDRRGVGSNERLEFIGDRVLGLLIAEWLIERFPLEQEGELGPRHALLVSRSVLGEIAVAAGLSAALSIAPNEARAGVASLTNVLADATEALIGAMYLDSGLEPARRFVRRAWLPAIELQRLPPKDPKTALQERLMARGRPLPIYGVVSRTGPSHGPSFIISVAAEGHTGTGTAGSKRLAERLAAADLLEKLTK